MKRLLPVILVLALLCGLFCACDIFGILKPNPQPNPTPTPDPDPEPNPQLTQSKVEFTSPANGVPLYNGLKVSVDGTELPLYNVKVNNQHSWQPNPTTSRSDSGAGYMFLQGNATVSVSMQGLTSCIVRPLSAKVTASVQNGVATFTLSSAGNYSVEPNGDPTKAVFLFVSDFSAKDNGNVQGNVIRFSRGVHTSANSSYINSDNAVVLNSNTTVVLEDGAVVRAKFVANNANNITVCGTGIIDGSVFTRNATTNEVTVPLDFNYCTNVSFKDFSVLDPAGWCVNWYFCSDCKIDNIKIITSRSNGDGISLQSCKRINVTNCFLRTWDDSLVVKNYPQWANKNNEGATENITFENCTVWTDLAQSMEVGYETVGKTLKDVSFRSITVLHNFHKPVISIHNGNNADVTNVTYDTITVEDASMGKGDAGSNNQLIELAVEYSGTWSDQHKQTALGSINGVTVQNVSVLSGNSVQSVRIAGSRDTRAGYGGTSHFVTNVTLQNVWLSPDKKLNANYSYFSKNEFTSGITVTMGDNMVTAPFRFSLTPEQSAAYTPNANVTVL